MEIVTAIANDFGYDQVFEFQLSSLAMDGDVLIVVSSSGNSPNILSALISARTQGIKSIAMTGFNGGKAQGLADVSLRVDAENYGVVEDVHQSLMHIMAQYIRQKRLLARDQIGSIKF
jgi:phosphoheptose isomerase